MSDQWRYRCPKCVSMSFYKRVRLGGWRCRICGTFFEQRLDMNTMELEIKVSSFIDDTPKPKNTTKRRKIRISVAEMMNIPRRYQKGRDHLTNYMIERHGLTRPEAEKAIKVIRSGKYKLRWKEKPCQEKGRAGAASTTLG